LHFGARGRPAAEAFQRQAARCESTIKPAISFSPGWRQLAYSNICMRINMIIETRIIGDIRVLDCAGKITLGEGTLSIRNGVRSALESGTKNIILNLNEVTYIDSSGLGELMRTHTSIANAGGKLKLLRITEKARELLAMSKLLTVFEIFEDEKEALASFDQPVAHSS
jgi:anti-sigma B factor antagonist